MKFILAHNTARERAIEAVKSASEGWCITIKEPTRREIQSERFHAMCGDVAKQAEWMGKKRSKDQWKLLFVSAHAVATQEGLEMVPGLMGEFLNIRESTAQMSVKRMSSLIEYVHAWGAENNVKWSEPDRG